MGIELTIFYTFLILYHYLIFRRRLIREAAKAKTQQETLQNISMNKELDYLSPTQQSSLSADKTQRSDPIKRTAPKNKSGNKIKEKKTLKVGSRELHDENTQDDDSAKSLLDKAVRTQSPSSSLNHTPTMHNTPSHINIQPTMQTEDEKTRSLMAPIPEQELWQRQDEEADMKTALDNLWF